MSVCFGLVVSGQNPEGMPSYDFYRKTAIQAEKLGFDSIWSTDHISFVNPILEGLIALAHLSGCTQRIKLGIGVLLLPLRHPTIVAKQFASLDFLSGGRTILGVGVGGEGKKDFEAVEIPLNQRGGRTNEAIKIVRELWKGAPVTFSGSFYKLENISIDPPPIQTPGPPIWVGGRSPAALRRTYMLGDGWLAYPSSSKRVRKDWDVIRRGAESAGRSAEEITFGQTLTIAVTDSLKKGRDQVARHLSARYKRPYDAQKVSEFSIAGPPEACVEQLNSYIKIGVRHFVFIPTAPPSQMNDEIGRIHSEVLQPFLKN